MRCTVAFAIIVPLISSAAFAETITGKVIDKQGKPIPGAKISVIQPQGAPDYGIKVIATLTTDAAGAFSADLKGEDTKKSDGTPGPRWFGTAIVTADGFGFDEMPLQAMGNTFTLAKAGVIRGKVVDAAGKPVAGTPVRITYFTPKQADSSPINRRFIGSWRYRNTPFEALFMGKTDADGTFAIKTIPEGIDGNVELAGSEFALANKPFSMSGNSTVTLVAKPTPVITGKAIDAEGKPLVDIQITVLSQFGSNNGKTGADGVFRITRLPAATAIVTARDTKDERVAAAQPNITLTEGKTTTLPDFVMDAGGMVDATVVDDETGKPLSAWVSVNSPDWPSTPMTGGRGQDVKEGHAQIRVAPGSTQISVGSLPGYPDAGGALPQTLSVKKGETVPVTFRMKRGIPVAGVVVGEDDRPLAGIHLRILSEWQSWEFERDPGTPTDAAGKWRQGAISRTADRLKIFVDDPYVVVSPEKLDIANLKGPLTVKVKKGEGRPLAGRVVTPDGSPLANVSINVSTYIRTTDGNITDNTNKNLTSDENGRFLAKMIRPKTVVQVRPSMNGCRYLSGGEIRDLGDSLALTDIVMARCTASASGRVLDTAGKPVAGVTVWSREGLPEAKTTTDAQGKFVLEHLPTDGPVNITAGRGRLISVLPLRMRGGKPTNGTLTDLVISLEPTLPGAEENTLRTLLDSLKGEAATNTNWKNELNQVARILARRNPDLALQWRADSNGKIADPDRFAILEEVCKRNPTLASTWGVAQAAQFTEANWKCCAESELALTLAPTQPDLANQLYISAIGHMKESETSDPYNFARLAAASVLLHRGEEESLITRMNQLTPESWQRMGTISVIARGDWLLAEKMVDDLKEDVYRPGALSQMIGIVAKTSPLTARQLLEKMQKGIKPNDYSGNMDLVRATRRVIRAVGPTDPETALAIARALPPMNDLPQYRPMVLASAAIYQKGESAKALWREVANQLELTRYGDTGGRLAELAQLCAVNGGPAEIVQELRKRAVAAAEQMGYYNSDEAFVFGVGFFDPPLARRAAEQMIDFQGNVPPSDQHSYSMASTAMALVSSDPAYAMQLIDAVPDEQEDEAQSGKGWARFINRVNMAKVLLLSPKERQSVLFTDFRYNGQMSDLD